jgi:hypothetical protein
MIFVGFVHASTQVGGVIASDATWTLAESPYMLTGTVVVNGGVTLTIEPGVVVDLYRYSIMVGGTLNAQGTSDSPIVFQTSYPPSYPVINFLSGSDWDEPAQTGCIIKNAIVSSVAININNCSAKIINNYFSSTNVYSTVTVNMGSPLISNNAFDCRGIGVNILSGNATVSNNYLKCQGNYGITASNNAYISNNNITGCSTGVYVTGNSIITRNLITSNTYGVRTSAASAEVENNVIANNNYGISGGGAIRNNTIGINIIGMDITLPANLTQNNIFGNTQYNLRMSMSNTTTIDATYNWWGTTDTQAINQTIRDHKTSPSVGQVNFTPFLNEPNPQAPATQSINLIPAPTPTAYPTPTLAPTPTLTPRSTATFAPVSTPTPTPEPTITPIPTPTSPPTPSPTPKIMPGSPLSLGGTSFAEAISQFDITAIAELVLMALGIVWLIVILFYVDRDFIRKENKKHRDK